MIHSKHTLKKPKYVIKSQIKSNEANIVDNNKNYRKIYVHKNLQFVLSSKNIHKYWLEYLSNRTRHLCSLESSQKKCKTNVHKYYFSGVATTTKFVYW